MKHIVITLNITIGDDGDDQNSTTTSYKPYIWPRTDMLYPPRPAKRAWSSYMETLSTNSKQKTETTKVITFPTCKLLEGQK
jgi:hypothetical protein